jgi:glycosyltransferase involved in cell wall biosynthesis
MPNYGDEWSMVPQLSIIIASINGRSYLAECLTALQQQTGNISAEIIVADCVGITVTDFVAAVYPEIKLIAVNEFQTVAMLRATAISVAAGEIIAITEDHCIPPPNWYESIWQAHHQHPAMAIGGAVDNGATDCLLDWAVYFCEYGKFMSPVTTGVVFDLPAPNVSYKQAGLIAILDQLKQGYRETFLHDYLNSHGEVLWSDATISMIHKKHFTLFSFLTERYHYSRAFAGQRNKTMHPGQRLLYLCLAPLLPPILLVRLSRQVLSRKRHIQKFCFSLPYLVIFTVIWAIGEVVGYAIGPGNSEKYLA